MALKLFIDKGYTRTTIADIEAAAGLVPRAGAFYRHYRGKAELAAEIGEASVLETRERLGFEGALPLGDTRAELILIAKGYREAADRQAEVAGLIYEVRHLKPIRDLVQRVDREIMESITGWLATKRLGRGMSHPELISLGLAVFGGWTFYLEKRGSGIFPRQLTDDFALERWSDFWARILDGSPSQ